MLSPSWFLASLVLMAATGSAQCPGCSVSYTGQGCGPSLTVTLETRNPSVAEIGVLFRNGNPNGFAFMILGLQELNLQLAGTPCFIYTDVVLGHLVQTHGDGSFDWIHPWPDGNPGTVRIEVFDFLWPSLQQIRSTLCAKATRTS